MQRLIGLFLSFVKWPLALLVAVVTPAALIDFVVLCKQIAACSFWKSPFGVGFMVAALFWHFLGRLPFFTFWSTAEHEFTHAIFAWCTFVPVRQFRTTDGTQISSGDRTLGDVLTDGGNWLISVSPYFFPTAPVLLMALTWMLAARSTILGGALLGATTAYSIASTWRETHGGQTDLQVAGFRFCWLFLPGANIVAYSIILGYQLGGLKEGTEALTTPLKVTLQWLGV